MLSNYSVLRTFFFTFLRYFRWSDETAIDYTAWAEGFPATDNNGHYCATQPSKNNGRRFESFITVLRGKRPYTISHSNIGINIILLLGTVS